jgi:D-arginine dehydrogenase
VDVAMLLEAMLGAAIEKGARLLTGERVDAVATSAGHVTGVRIPGGPIEARQVVVAAGGWAADVAATGRASRIPLRPRRRHLFTTRTLPWVDHHWPIVWDLTHGLFFRPEPPGLLLSPCDESDTDPGIPTRDPAAAEMLLSKLGLFMPRLAELPLYASWAGLHTVTPDGGFVLGRDPQVEGLVWCAGLGEHGVAACPAVGRLAAEAVLGRSVPREHDAARFAGAAGRDRRPPLPRVRPARVNRTEG